VKVRRKGGYLLWDAVKNDRGKQRVLQQARLLGRKGAIPPRFRPWSRRARTDGSLSHWRRRRGTVEWKQRKRSLPLWANFFRPSMKSLSSFRRKGFPGGKLSKSKFYIPSSLCECLLISKYYISTKGERYLWTKGKRGKKSGVVTNSSPRLLIVETKISDQKKKEKRKGLEGREKMWF